MATKSFHLNIDSEMLDKLFFIADYNGRTATGQIIYMIRKLLEEYEEQHGEIPTGAGKQLRKKD